MRIKKLFRTGEILFCMTAAMLICFESNVFAADWVPSGNNIYYDAGNVGIGTTTPTAKMDVDSANSIAGDFRVTRSSNQYLKAVYAGYTDSVSGATTGGQALWVQATHNAGASFSNYNASIMGALYLVNLQGSNTMRTTGVTVQSNDLTFASSGNYSFNNVNANSSAIGAADADEGTRTITNLAAFRGEISLENSHGTWNVENASIFYAPAMIPHRHGTIVNTAGLVVEKQSIGTNNMGVWLKGDGMGADLVVGANKETRMYGNGGNLIINTAGNVGIGTGLDPEAKLHVAGDVKVDGNIAAKYQDLAEYVKTSGSLTSGTVVMIDPKEINQVLPSDKAYNTLVAGVVSNAPGIILGEEGADKAMIAHTGRVKVKVDTSNGEILVGDLLVTSPVKGHAMKADSDKLKPGMLLGKALEPLAGGQQGEILTLITLQ